MKVAYVFATSGHTASYKLGKMILPQLEENRHGVEVVGMMFFDDNNYILRQGDPIGTRLAKVAKEKGVLLMMCDQCALERGLAEGELGELPGQRNRRRRTGRMFPRPLCRPGGKHAGSGHHAVAGETITSETSRLLHDGVRRCPGNRPKPNFRQPLRARKNCRSWAEHRAWRREPLTNRRPVVGTPSDCRTAGRCGW